MSIHIGQRLPYKVNMDGQTIPLSGIEGENNRCGSSIYRWTEKRREKAKRAAARSCIELGTEKGKSEVWERLDYLFDEGSFQEVGSLLESRFTDFGMDQKKLPGDGVVTGFGTIHGEPVYCRRTRLYCDGYGT